MRKMLSRVLIVCLIFGSNLSVFAAEATPRILDNGTIINSTLSNEYLIDSGCSIDFYISDNEIIASGYTNTYTNVNSIYVKIFIQRYDGDKWVTVISKSDTNYSRNKVSCNVSITPRDKGEYRAYAIHKISHNGTDESDVSHTNSINVN